MTIFLLTPIDVESEHWKYSTHKGEVIARAPDEGQARLLANDRFAMPREHVPGAETQHMIWSVPELVTCETIDDWEGETDGKVAILYPPVSQAVDDLRREVTYLRAMAYLAEHQAADVRTLAGYIRNHFRGQACTEAIQSIEIDTHIVYWATEVKKTGERDLLIKIAPGLRKIADELERRAAVPEVAN